VPAGGGGLIGGIGLAAHAIEPRVTVVGVQSTASPALHAVLAHGAGTTVEVKPSLADGLAGNIETGSITVELLQRHVREILMVEEPQIAAAMRWLLDHEHVLVEGSAAVGVAAVQSLKDGPGLEGPVVVVLTGRNVAASVLQQYVLGQTA
ncbi:MAG TPA: pyridoxal-phosphate dependent enzyme, partial [Chloroflexota bacterium]